ncbi:hypothetical protein [Streptomyces olivaceus]
MLKRRLIFHRWHSVNGRAKFTPHETAAELQAAIAYDSDFSILDVDGTVTAVEVVDVGSADLPTNLRVLALRNPDDRPFKWDASGSVSPISLGDHEYPADVTHVSIWPDGICAHDFGKNVPRLSRLDQFLRRKLHHHVSFDALYREDMLEKLEALKGQLRSVEVALVQTDTRQDTGVFRTLFPAAFGNKVPSIRFTLGMGRYGPRNRYLDGETEEEVFELARQADDFVSNMIIRGRNGSTGDMETINLLQERLQVETEFRRSGTIPSMPDPGTVFIELDQTYKDFKRRERFKSAVEGQKMRSRKK